ncbi:MAG: hypothetical protein BVN35_08140 [Proteobacteria bacterium ST_bin11]|nr:MAG: hypothetical protein BVN35_08140 [Proteobacteria bacterium ST_bin11]
MAENNPKIESVALVLAGTVFNVPIELCAAFADEGGTQNSVFSGKAKFHKPLSEFFQALSGQVDEEAGRNLRLLVGENHANPILDKLALAYQSGQRKSAQFSVTLLAGDNRFEIAAIKQFANGGFAVGVTLQSDGKPILGNRLQGLIGDVGFKAIGVQYASKALRDVPCLTNDDVVDLSLLPPPLRYFDAGINVTADILIGGINPLQDLLTKLPPATADDDETLADDSSPPNGRQAPSLSDHSPIHWFETGKTIGPLSLRRIGLGFQSRRVAIKIDAGLKFSCLMFSLEGLGLTYPIDQLSTDPQKIWEHVRFQLDGASMGFSQGPITISGGLLKVPSEQLQLDGTLLVRTPLFGLSALASYANLNGTTSFFMFGVVHKALGGPAFFFVTGLALGFGVNRSLKLPPLEDVHNFPLIRAATDQSYLAENLDLRAISQKLAQYVAPSEGNYWLAAGIKFTSFGQIDSFVLLSVSFGTRLEFGLLGLSRLQVPKLTPGATTNAIVPTLVYAEMAIRAVVAPDSGVICLEARLTENSYILRNDFKIRGGFAFYAWYSGIHAGDFVVSLGGYHNKFKVPAHYPRPELVEFTCKIGNTVTINGSCYFALCPSAIMAGGQLNIIFQSGSIKAWFTAYAHFLIQWKPVYYEALIGVSIGVALRLNLGVIRTNISAELSADAKLFGPPLAGEVRVSVAVVTFTIKFGEPSQAPTALVWESTDVDKSFAASFLPPTLVTIAITDGMVKEIQQDPKNTFVVSAQKLTLNLQSAIPLTAITVNVNNLPLVPPQPTIAGKPAELGVRPMGKTSYHSTMEVVLSPLGDDTTESEHYLSQFLEFNLQSKSVPIALWSNGNLDKTTPPTDQMIDNVLSGLEIKTKAGPRPWQTPALDLSVLAYDSKQVDFSWALVKPKRALSGFGEKSLGNTIASDEVVQRRAAILDKLAASGRHVTNAEQLSLGYIAKHAEYIFQDMPAMARVGQYRPRAYLDT